MTSTIGIDCLRPWKILCDFDGTICTPDATDAILERLAAPAWRDIERDWRAGLIGSRDCMSRQIALVEATEREFDEVLDRIIIDPAFPMFVERCRQSGVELNIVSDGLDRAIRRILARLGLDDLPIFSNALVPDGERRWLMQSPHADAGCVSRSGTCKCALAKQGDASAGPAVLLVGDGLSDFCVAGRADFVFAKSRLLDHCRSAGIAHRAIQGFGDAVDLLPELLAGTLGGPIRPIPPPRIAYA